MAPRMRRLHQETAKGKTDYRRPSVQERLKSILWVRPQGCLVSSCSLLQAGSFHASYTAPVQHSKSGSQLCRRVSGHHCTTMALQQSTYAAVLTPPLHAARGEQQQAAGG